MPSTSKRSRRPSVMGSANVTLSWLPCGCACASTLARESPSRAVILVVVLSNEPPSGSTSVTSLTCSPSSTVPSHVKRVGRPPITFEPPSSLGRAVALLVVSADACEGTISTSASSIAATKAATPALPSLLQCLISAFLPYTMLRDPTAYGASQPLLMPLQRHMPSITALSQTNASRWQPWYRRSPYRRAPC